MNFQQINNPFLPILAFAIVLIGATSNASASNDENANGIAVTYLKLPADQRVADRLQRLKVQYQVNSIGDYCIEVKEDETVHVVFIQSATTRIGEEESRLVSTSIPVPGSQIAKLAPRLMQINQSGQACFCGLQFRADGQYWLTFNVRISAESSHETLKAAIHNVVGQVGDCSWVYSFSRASFDGR